MIYNPVDVSIDGDKAIMIALREQEIARTQGLEAIKKVISIKLSPRQFDLGIHRSGLYQVHYQFNGTIKGLAGQKISITPSNINAREIPPFTSPSEMRNDMYYRRRNIRRQ